ncbi:MAG: alpha/beta hydrolase [Fimbriimonas sp.]
MASSLVNVVRPGSDPGGPLLVLLHGLGSNERDLMEFAHYLDPRLTVVAFRAPNAYGYGGFSWFDIQWLPEGRVIDEAGAVRSRDLLIEELEVLRKRHNASRLVLGGFSQGAMMTLGAALARPELVDAALLMSGRAMPVFLASATEGGVTVPFFAQHGVRDDVLPVEDAREMRDALTALGARLEYREYPMGHEVTMESLQDAIAWIGRHAFPG